MYTFLSFGLISSVSCWAGAPFLPAAGAISFFFAVPSLGASNFFRPGSYWAGGQLAAGNLTFFFDVGSLVTSNCFRYDVIVAEGKQDFAGLAEL